MKYPCFRPLFCTILVLSQYVQAGVFDTTVNIFFNAVERPIWSVK